MSIIEYQVLGELYWSGCTWHLFSLLPVLNDILGIAGETKSLGVWVQVRCLAKPKNVFVDKNG